MAQTLDTIYGLWLVLMHCCFDNINQESILDISWDHHLYMNSIDGRSFSSSSFLLSSSDMSMVIVVIVVSLFKWLFSSACWSAGGYRRRRPIFSLVVMQVVFLFVEGLVFLLLSFFFSRLFVLFRFFCSFSVSFCLSFFCPTNIHQEKRISTTLIDIRIEPFMIKPLINHVFCLIT